MENNVLEISIAVIPVFVYIYLIQRVIPKGMAYKGRAKRYFLAGMVLPIICWAVKFAFPTLFINQSIFFAPSLKQALHLDYIEAALVEECLKLTAFFYVQQHRRNGIYDVPIATLFYYMLCSAGFALSENIIYLMKTGDVLIRSYSAIVMHVITGVIAGYYTQKALNVKQVLIEKASQWETYKPLLKKGKIIAQGVCAALLFHGTYNFNFSLPNNYYALWHMTVMLALGVVVAKFMINEAVKSSKDLRRKNYHKDYYENFR